MIYFHPIRDFQLFIRLLRSDELEDHYVDWFRKLGDNEIGVKLIAINSPLIKELVNEAL